MIIALRFLAVGTMALAVAACTTVVDQDSFAPQPRTAPAGELVVPSGYSASAALIGLPGLGEVHAVRLVHPAAEATILVSGGNGHFVNTSGKRLGALASATGANLIVYDYPGRGGTTIPTRSKPRSKPARSSSRHCANGVGLNPPHRCSPTGSHSAAPRLPDTPVPVASPA